ncbi:DNA/RNA polymerase [Metschnikowia bicuspidata]|uniref:DNA/RNA polymerase n=1 Tax=Metschnikowia bicuspidata TaxID=27322 RepID=A0A4V1J349_9ASCO|nr:DNA/RNA polymerase [Metschnikowia bicuspidata]
MSVLKKDTSLQVLRHQCTQSAFTARQLRMLLSPAQAYLLPLAVIALIDMNAFFAQCEQVRLGKSLEDPVVCCQWRSLIAVSYAARKYGISRMETLSLALKKCPALVVGHAAVFRKGEAYWKYVDGLPDQALHKVCLDPYRRELRKVFRVLQTQCDAVEKASIDECYLDLGRLVYHKMVEFFPVLADLADNDRLPPIPAQLPEELRWSGTMYQSEDEKRAFDTALDNPTLDPAAMAQALGILLQDWDDVCQIVGSQFLHAIRAKIYEELSYTTSGGLATTKAVAKLAAGHVKPDHQTLVRSRAVHAFLSNFELTDVTSMGGMVGKDIVRRLQVPAGVESTSYIRKEFTLKQLKEEFPQDPALAVRVYEFCRGTHKQEFKRRSAMKSMMSRKNFIEKTPVKTVGDAYDWIKVFVGDLYGRLVELDHESMNLSLLQQEAGDRASIARPRTVAVQFTTSAWERQTRQTKFPVIRDLTRLRTALEAAYFRLLCQMLDTVGAKDAAIKDAAIKYADLRAEDPCLYQIPIATLANLSVTVNNFVKTTDASLIDTYGKGGVRVLEKESICQEFEQKPTVAVAEEHVDRNTVVSDASRPKAARRNSYVRQLFTDFEKEQLRPSEPAVPVKQRALSKEDKDYVKKMFEDYQHDAMVQRAVSKMRPAKDRAPAQNADSAEPQDAFLKELMRTQRCARCNTAVDDVFEHRDFHVALDLSARLNNEPGAQKRRRAEQSVLPF